MFSLVISLAVVALSGAVVLLVVREEPQPATPSPGSLVQSPSPEQEEAAQEEAPAEEEAAPAAGRPRASIRSVPPPTRHPIRSAVLLVLLLATVGALLALVVAVALGLLVMAMRAGVG
ncbi:MAG: hypothetical protein KY450_14705 [Actinobacteria bacterium]|nr:hypothetical protein [Actinomycetota bacterium]